MKEETKEQKHNRIMNEIARKMFRTDGKENTPEEMKEVLNKTLEVLK